MVDITPLSWDSRSFNYEGMVALKLDSNKTFYYSLLGTYFKPFINNLENREIIVDGFCRGIKEYFVDVNDHLLNGVYGHLKIDESEKYNQDLVLRELDINTFNLRLETLQLISDRINKDIYILDKLNWEAWIPEDLHYDYPLNILYKDRDSIVLLKSVDKYEIVGLSIDESVPTCFKCTNPFIKKIRKYLHNIYSL